jgi:hypothetical protein
MKGVVYITPAWACFRAVSLPGFIPVFVPSLGWVPR